MERGNQYDSRRNSKKSCVSLYIASERHLRMCTRLLMNISISHSYCIFLDLPPLYKLSEGDEDSKEQDD